MRRWFAVASIAAVLGACTTERVIIVQQPPQGGGSSAGAVNAGSPSSGQQVAGDADWGIQGRPNEQAPDYARVVSKVANMVGDSSVTSGASRRGLSVVNVMWED